MKRNVFAKWLVIFILAIFLFGTVGSMIMYFTTPTDNYSSQQGQQLDTKDLKKAIEEANLSGLDLSGLNLAISGDQIIVTGSGTENSGNKLDTTLFGSGSNEQGAQQTGAEITTSGAENSSTSTSGESLSTGNLQN